MDVSDAEATPTLRQDTSDTSGEGQAAADTTDQKPRRPVKPSEVEDPAAVEIASLPDARVQRESREMAEAPGPGFDRPTLEGLAGLGITASPEGPIPDEGRIDISAKLTGFAAVNDRTPPPSPSKGIGTAAAFGKTGHVKADPQRGEMVVSQGQYMALFKSWRAAGDGGRDTEKILLRVQNLRESYELFQIKPIAVVRRNTYLDLSDWTRVSEGVSKGKGSSEAVIDGIWSEVDCRIGIHFTALNGYANTLILIGFDGTIFGSIGAFNEMFRGLAEGEATAMFFVISWNNGLATAVSYRSALKASISS